jgi:hypothetical protein
MQSELKSDHLLDRVECWQGCLLLCSSSANAQLEGMSIIMNWDQVEGKCKEVRGKAQAQ